MDSNPSSVTDNSPVTLIASQFRPDPDAVIAICEPNGAIAVSLIAASNQKLCRSLLFVFSPFLFLSVLGIIPIIIFIRIQNSVVIIVCAIFSFIFLLVSLVLWPIAYLRVRADSLGQTEHYAIRIEGDQWERYLTYWLDKNGRHRKFSYDCASLEKRMNEFRSRGYGYVIIGRNGFMIDELFYITYKICIIDSVKVLPNGNQSGAQENMLRVKYNYRYYDLQYSYRDGFHVDIFMPPKIPKNELRKIKNFIMGKTADSLDSVSEILEV